MDIAKLRDYSLSALHPEGKHKARVFQAALGLGPDDAEWLRDELLAAARREECQPAMKTAHGQRYSLTCNLHKDGLEARVRSAWIVRTNEKFPRLASCYVV